MARKRKPYAAIRPWCWYCEVNFDSEKKLFEHQRKKHFTCQKCDRKFKGITSLVEHNKSEHQIELKAVPSALPGRDSVLVSIRGTEGIPECDVLAHNLKSRQNNNPNQEFDETYLDSSQELSHIAADDSIMDPSISQYQSYISEQNLHMGSGYPEVYPGYPNHHPIPLHHPYQQTQPYHPVHPMTGSHFYPDSRYPNQVNHLYSNLYRPPPLTYDIPNCEPQTQNGSGKQIHSSYISSTIEKDSQSSIPTGDTSLPDSNGTLKSPHNASISSSNQEPSSVSASHSLNPNILASSGNDIDAKSNSEHNSSFRSISRHHDSSKHPISRLQKEALVFKHPTDKLLSPHAFSPPSESSITKKSLSNLSELNHNDSPQIFSLASKSLSSSHTSNISDFVSPKRINNLLTDNTDSSFMDNKFSPKKRSSCSFDEQSDSKMKLKSTVDYKSDHSSPPILSNGNSKEVIICQFKTISMEEARAQDKRYKFREKILREEVDALESSINKHVALIISKRAN